MPNDCPSFPEVGGYLFVFVISAGMLVYIFLFWSVLFSEIGPGGYLFILAFMVLILCSAYKMYQSLFPECWI